MTAKLSDLRVELRAVGDGAGRTVPVLHHVSLAELLAMLEAEGVLRREYSGAYTSADGIFAPWRFVGEWNPAERVTHTMSPVTWPREESSE